MKNKINVGFTARHSCYTHLTFHVVWNGYREEPTHMGQSVDMVTI